MPMKSNWAGDASAPVPIPTSVSRYCGNRIGEDAADASDWCPDSEVRMDSRRTVCELRNQRDTSNCMILVPLLNPKFANALAAKSCELRVRGTSAPPQQAARQTVAPAPASLRPAKKP